MAKSQAEMLIEQDKTREEVKKSEKVKIKLPRDPQDPNGCVYVGLNGIGYQIKRGIEVTVPLAVAEIIENSEEMAAKSTAYIASVTK